MKFYADWAVRITHGQWTDGQAFYGLPGYAFCLAAIFRFAGVNPMFVGMIQVCLEVVTTVFIFKIAKVVTANSQKREGFLDPDAVGILASLGWIFYLPAQTFSTILMPSAWLVSAFWGCLWWLTTAREWSAWWKWGAAGMFLGVIAMMVATVLFLTPLFLCAILLRLPKETFRRQCTRALLAGVALFAGLFAGTSPAWVHNYFVAKDPVLLSAHGGLNFWMGNNPEATGYPKIPEGLSAGQEGLLRDSITRAEEAAGHPLTRSAVSTYWSEKADVWVRANRGAWLRLLGVKVRNFWNAFQYDDLSEITLLQGEGILTAGVSFGLVAALGLPGMLMAAWRLPRARWVAAAVLLHLCALLPVFITERYRLCAVPGLLIFAAFLIVETWRAFARGRWRQAGILLAGLGMATWFVSTPPREPGLWALDPFNTGLKVLRAGNLVLAEEKLNTAWRLVPENAEINFGLGNLWFEKNSLARSRQAYRHTIVLDAKHAGAWMNLGRVETKEKDWAAARECLQRAIALNPTSVKAHLFLAEMELAAGNSAEADIAIAAALKLRPGQPELLELKAKIDSARAR